MSIPQYLLDDPFLTPKDIMKIIELPRSTVYYKINMEMRHYRFGRRLKVKTSDFQKWLDRQAKDPFII